MQMRRTFSFTGVTVAVNYALASVAFITYLNWYDTGKWDFDGWTFMAAGGFLFGCLSVIIERELLRQFGLWLRKTVLFLLRHIITGSIIIALSMTALYAGFILLAWFTATHHQVVTLASILLAPFMALVYIPMIIPFGTIAGLMSGLLLRSQYQVTLE